LAFNTKLHLDENCREGFCKGTKKLTQNSTVIFQSRFPANCNDAQLAAVLNQPAIYLTVGGNQNVGAPVPA